MKFLTDSMLGRLTRWLRLSGYDVFYSKKSCDESILDIAAREGRVLITRDKKLSAKATSLGVDSVLLASNDLVEQLRQLIEEKGVDVKDTPESARCPLCNSTVRVVDKEAVSGKVPETVLQEIGEFWACDSCAKVYWYGGHWKKIKEIAERI